jgi:Mn2+/Fe2+ NRAMP family transporter
MKIRNLALIAPGLLVAATGVGAGDLITASLGGSAIGLSLLWAAWVGAVLKWFLNEGIARWQMATGMTLLEGWITHLGIVIRYAFVVYLLVWSVVVSGALITACGIAGTGLFPIGSDPVRSKQIWGIAHAVIGLVLVWVGGFKLIERLMAMFIAVMFACVVTTAGLLVGDWSPVLEGLLIPRLPMKDGLIDSAGMSWLLGVLGGVGGTLTLLSYGYWIREAGRSGEPGWRTCRIDLAVGYAVTGLFGICMILIGSQLELEGKGAQLGVVIADKMAQTLGSPSGDVARWLFLVGFWGAVFSSLLGVWQSVPYLFADFTRLSFGRNTGHDQPPENRTSLTATGAYRGYLIFLTFSGLPLLWFKVAAVQLSYAVLGALFMPFLALTLLVMNNHPGWVNRRMRNGWVTNIVLGVTLVFFGWIGVRKLFALL